MTVWMTQDPYSRDYLGTVTVHLSLNQMVGFSHLSPRGLPPLLGEMGMGRAKAIYYFLLRVSKTRDLALA